MDVETMSYKITENTPENIDFYTVTYYPMEQLYAIGVWYKDGRVYVHSEWFDDKASAIDYVKENLTVKELKKTTDGDRN